MVAANATAAEYEHSAALPEAERAAVRDLILVLADSKRLLGMRYADWTLGAPELEAGIACASMAQDEWGHARQLYALLRDFGDDTEQLEHGRSPEEYRSMALLDQPPQSWPELVVLNALLDTAITAQIVELETSSYAPLRGRVEKLLEEERFHAAHGAAWFRRLAGANERARAALHDAVDRALPSIVAWFGPDSDRTRQLVAARIVGRGATDTRQQYLARIADLIALVGIDGKETESADFSTFREDFRRPAGTAPDPGVIAKVRGDLNRAFLMD